jgi:8-oxo-dGTP pyrophosphatase MutT (NUDIX family)
VAAVSSDGDETRLAWLAEGNARQARKRVATKALIRDHAGRILLVNPTYKEYWDLPGGMAEAHESPTEALRREILEELGLYITVGRLLTLDWVGPHGPWDDQLTFLFNGGSLTSEQMTTITVADNEISAFGFYTLSDAIDRLRADIAQRLTRATSLLRTGHTDYTETHNPDHPE